MLDRLAEKGKITGDLCRRHKECIVARQDLNDLKEADVVVEAIVENAEAKQDLFRQLEDVVSGECILASNTSSIPISLLASAARVPSRIAGLHFFNPIPLMKIVEVVSGIRTSPAVADQLVRLGERMGHYAPRIADSPGFLVNHAGRGYGLEALRIQSEGIASPAEIDMILREGAGFKMGPFELLDLIGIDVTHSVMESIYNLYYHEPRYKPSVLTRMYKDAHLNGRKTGKGFYDYDAAGKIIPVPGQVIPEGKEAPVWVGIQEADARQAVMAILEKSNCRIDANRKPGDAAICLMAPLGEDATSCALRHGLPPGRMVALDTIFGIKERVCLMASPVVDRGLLYFICHAFLKAGRRVSLINDSCGFVVQRVLANIVNVSCEIAQQRVAEPEDINRAVKLGLGYPMGSLEFGDVIGPAKILEILEKMHDFYKDPRYRPSPWLKRRAMLGVPLLTKENLI
jgi:3-hydroxybutyryl-CoA dehydrogenase